MQITLRNSFISNEVSECKKNNLDFNETFNEENIEKICKDLKLDNLDDIYFKVILRCYNLREQNLEGNRRTA